MSITHRDHFVNIARRRASEANKFAAKKKEDSNTEANGLSQNNHDKSQQEECLSTSSTDYKGGFFADQFENLANYRAHYEGTGPEIWDQTGGNLHAFVAAAGTGGTLAGVSRFLKVFGLSSTASFYVILQFELILNLVLHCALFAGEESSR